MDRKFPDAKTVIHELTFVTSRSSGPGGQNVNKVNSKVTLQLDVVNSAVLSDEEKEIILKKCKNQLTTDGVLILTSQNSRSQHENKQLALEKLDQFFREAFKKRKPRKATSPSKASVKKRLDKKKSLGEKKKLRQKPKL